MAKPVTKAKEITDARISFVSLVDKAANKRPFLIVKNEDGKAAFTTYGRIIKSDDDRHFVTGIVYEPMTEDAHGNYMTADEIAKAAYWFAKNGNKVDLQHNFVSEEGTAVVESWIAKTDCDIGGETVKEGTWLMTVEINDDSLWQSIQNGEITGLSMGGLGVYAQEDTDLSSASVTKAQGRVEKGAVTDNFKQSNTSSSFWNAYDALRSALYTYNGYTGTYTYQTDEDTIKAALEEFGAIITNLLTDATSEKPLTKSLFECKPTPELGRIEKAGRSLSAKNREACRACMTVWARSLHLLTQTLTRTSPAAKLAPRKIPPTARRTTRAAARTRARIRQRTITKRPLPITILPRPLTKPTTPTTKSRATIHPPKPPKKTRRAKP